MLSRRALQWPVATLVQRRLGATLDLHHGLPGLLVALVAATLATAAGVHAQGVEEEAWRQWGGPHRNFMVEASDLAESWPPEGPPVLWSRSLGVGHSAIVVDDGLLFTMYRVGDSRRRRWAAEEVVIAMDAITGNTVWEYAYPSRIENFSFGAGPHSTPLVVGDRLFTTGTNKQLHVFDKETGALIWSHDLVADFNAPPLLIRSAVRAGYAVSPLPYKDTIILQVGGQGQAVMAFRQSDGAVAWKGGDFLVAEASPILIDVDGQPQLVVFGGQTINGLDPDTGRVLWTHPHDTGADMNNSTPIWGDDNILFFSSAYDTGSQALKLTREGSATRVDRLWSSRRLRIMFSSAVRIGDYVYGSDGDFGPAFLTALNITTGEPAWQRRGFGRASLLQAGDLTIVIDEDGDLVLAKLSPEGLTVLSTAKIFNTTSWTVPTLVGTTLYARDREKIAALDLGR